MAEPLSEPVAKLPTRPRRWVQFRLRSLLALMLLACGLMGWWRSVVSSYEKQYAAREKISRLTTVVGTEPAKPIWLRPLFKDGIFQDVVKVSLDGSGRLSDDDLAPLADFPRLRRLSVDGTALTDKGLAHLANLRDLETLSLNNTYVTSEGLIHLRKLKNLKRLELGNTEIDASGLSHLSGVMNLEFLELDCLNVTGNDLKHIENMRELRNLRLRETLIRGPGLSRLVFTRARPQTGDAE